MHSAAVHWLLYSLSPCCTAGWQPVSAEVHCANVFIVCPNNWVGLVCRAVCCNLVGLSGQIKRIPHCFFFTFTDCNCALSQDATSLLRVVKQYSFSPRDKSQSNAKQITAHRLQSSVAAAFVTKIRQDAHFQSSCVNYSFLFWPSI